MLVNPQVLADLFDTIRQYETPILADKDPEDLHQYRVNQRRLRSLLTPPPNKTLTPFPNSETLTPLFKQIFEHTNRLRDLDVYLAQLSTPTQISAEHPALWSQWLDYVQARRQEAFTQTAHYLESSNYYNTIQTIGAYITELPPSLVTIEVVSNLQSGAKLKRKLKKIDHHTPLEDLHKLRKHLKRYRYQLEHVTDNNKRHKRQLSTLKKAQLHLGELNDLHVQQNWLLQQIDMAKELSPACAFVAGLCYATNQQAQQSQIRALLPALRRLRRFF